MKNIAIALLALSPLLSPHEAAAQSSPKECADPGLLDNYVVFSMTLQISMLEFVCGEIAPETLPSFDRVLRHYRDTDPACYAATRNIAELRDLPKSPEMVALLSNYRNGSMPQESRDAILHNCNTIELSEKRARDEREAFKNLLQMTPSTSGGG